MIEAVKLTKDYHIGDRTISVLREVDLQAAKDEFVAVCGRSGSGKTTLLSLLAGLDHPTSGRVTVDGAVTSELSEDDLAPLRQRLMGFVFQSFHLIPTLSALENVLIPAQLLGERDELSFAKDLLDQVGLSHRLHHLPNELSGGEQQRVAICRALINRPKVIFADEPSGNLDSENEKIVLKLLRELRGDSALLLVTHDPEIAATADRVITIDDGQITNA